MLIAKIITKLLLLNVCLNKKLKYKLNKKKTTKIFKLATKISLLLNSNEKEENLIKPSQKIDEKENWAKNLILKYSGNFYSLNSKNYTQDY